MSLNSILSKYPSITPAQFGTNGGNNYQGGLGFGVLTGAGSSQGVGGTSVKGPAITPYDRDMADFRQYLPQNNGTGQLNPFSQSAEVGQSVYVKEGVNEPQQKQKPSELEAGKAILNNRFGGDSIAAMEYLLELEKIKQAA